MALIFTKKCLKIEARCEVGCPKWNVQNEIQHTLEHSSENKFKCRCLGFRCELYVSRPHNFCSVKKTIQNLNETKITSLRF